MAANAADVGFDCGKGEHAEPPCSITGGDGRAHPLSLVDRYCIGKVVNKPDVRNISYLYGENV